MKKQKTLWLSSAIVFAAFSLLAQDQKYQMSIQIAGKELNGQGKVVKHAINSKNLINDCATDAGFDATNRPPLLLVYHVGSGNPRLDTIEVVNKTNGTVVCTTASLTGGVAITNTDGTLIERQVFVYAGVNLADQIGSALVSEKIPNGDTSKRKIQGKIQLGLPGDGNGPQIGLGGFSTSKLFVTP